MTNFLDRSLAGALSTTLAERRDQLAAELISGIAGDYADYKGRASYIRCLNDTMNDIEKLTKEITGR
jgi:hypothetical protein